MKIEERREIVSAITMKILIGMTRILIEELGELFEAKPKDCKWVSDISVYAVSEKEADEIMKKYFMQYQAGSKDLN